LRAGRWWWESSHKECIQNQGNKENRKKNKEIEIINKEVLLDTTTLKL
jgi:hypothetical protein